MKIKIAALPLEFHVEQIDLICPAKESQKQKHQKVQELHLHKHLPFQLDEKKEKVKKII